MPRHQVSECVAIVFDPRKNDEPQREQQRAEKRKSDDGRDDSETKEPGQDGHVREGCAWEVALGRHNGGEIIALGACRT